MHTFNPTDRTSCRYRTELEAGFGTNLVGEVLIKISRWGSIITPSLFHNSHSSLDVESSSPQEVCCCYCAYKPKLVALIGGINLNYESEKSKAASCRHFPSGI
jgi:hypothetical protein